jgi:hypothetical protein
MGVRSVYISASQASSSADVLADVLDALDRANLASIPKQTVLQESLRGITSNVQMRAFRRDSTDSSIAAAVQDLASALAPTAMESEYSTILLDVVPKSKMVHEIFGRLRDQIWDFPLRWVVAGDADRAREYLTPPADAFFEAVVNIEPLSWSESETLLELRVPRSDAAVGLATGIVETAEGSPRRLITLARQKMMETSQSPANSAERAVILAELGRPAHMLLVELESLGPSSASDPALQDRMGWSRPRLVQVLKKLEDAGLVTSTEQRNGRGRPVKAYAVA